MLARGVNHKWDSCPSKGSTPSAGPPTYQTIKVTNANHMNMMKLAWQKFPCVLGSVFPPIRLCPGLSLATKGIGPLCCTVSTFVTCCLLRIISPHNHLLPTILVLADFSLLKTTCQILLLLVGFDTLTYRKDYDFSPILVGHQDSFLAPLPGSEAPLVSGTC